MVIKLWGLVPTSSGTRCVRLELRAEAGIMFRVSGVSHQAMLAWQAGEDPFRLAFVDFKWPGKAWTLHVSESRRPDQIRELTFPWPSPCSLFNDTLTPPSWKAYAPQACLDSMGLCLGLRTTA